MVRASGYGATEDYITQARDELFIALQIVSIKGVENTAEIAAVEGVDMIFIGANDLSGNCGMLSQYGHPEVVSQIEKSMAATKTVGKYLDTIPHPDADYCQLIETGFSWLREAQTQHCFVMRQKLRLPHTEREWQNGASNLHLGRPALQQKTQRLASLRLSV